MKYLALILALCCVFWYFVYLAVSGIVQGDVQDMQDQIDSMDTQVQAIRYTCNSVKRGL